MAIAKTLKFTKEDNGNVLLVSTQDNSVVASFNPAMSLQRDSGDVNRFRIATSTREGFLLDYRSIDCDLCVPFIVQADFNEFLIKLSKFFFFTINSSNNIPQPFGTFKWIARGTVHVFDHPIAGDLFEGFLSANEFSSSLIWNGIGDKDNTNLINFQILNTTQF